MSDELAQRIQDYLQNHNTLILTTADAGRPHATPLFYVNIGLQLYFLSEPGTRHCTELSVNPHVAVAVTEDYRKWQDIKGIQLDGSAGQVNGIVEQGRVMAAYLRKYPFVTDYLKTSDVVKQLSKFKLYKISPSTISFLDNAKGFSHKEVLHLD